jgi:hypothetical protein
MCVVFAETLRHREFRYCRRRPDCYRRTYHCDGRPLC